MALVKHNWTQREIFGIYNAPLLELVYKSATIHRRFHNPLEMQVSSLLSIKTGACSEDCAYCAQSASYKTGIRSHPLLSLDEVIVSAKIAKKFGATRFCMGASLREVRNNEDFEKILDIVKAVKSLGMETCCTLGMLSESQAQKLAEAGLDYYNHNINTSKEFYKKIVTTHTYDERVNTLKNIRKAGIKLCCGGIIGMGENIKDRIDMLLTLSSFKPHPESVPINAFIPIKGTPLENQPFVSVWDIIRMTATTRIIMPRSIVRLSAGRSNLSKEAQALCFLAGANSIFIGEKLLTQSNIKLGEDLEMLKIFGIKPKNMPDNKTKK